MTAIQRNITSDVTLWTCCYVITVDVAECGSADHLYARIYCSSSASAASTAIAARRLLVVLLQHLVLR